MADQYDVKQGHALAKGEPDKKRKVLVTGAAGRIGSFFSPYAADRYDLTLMVHPDIDETDRRDIAHAGEIVEADLADLEGLKDLMAGHDTVVHLAANPSGQATWDVLLPTNIVGTYNAFVAAKAAGVKRVVYASSIHAVGGYPPQRQVKTNDPPNPGDIYGVTKCFGEALGRYMANKEGLSVICIRIGAFQPVEQLHSEKGLSMVDAFVAHEDLAQLICRCVDTPDIQWAIVHGLSRSVFNRMDITDTCELLGYEPSVNVLEEIPELRKINMAQRLGSHSKADPSKSGLRNQLDPDEQSKNAG